MGAFKGFVEMFRIIERRLTRIDERLEKMAVTEQQVLDAITGVGSDIKQAVVDIINAEKAQPQPSFDNVLAAVQAIDVQVKGEAAAVQAGLTAPTSLTATGGDANSIDTTTAVAVGAVLKGTSGANNNVTPITVTLITPAPPAAGPYVLGVTGLTAPPAAGDTFQIV